MTPGQQIGPYLLEGTLGKGGMGAVYRARGPQGGAVALKVLHTLDPELLARFQREAQVLRHLNSLRIVRLLDFGVHAGRPYLVQELCEGGDLAGVLARRGALPPDEARSLIRELAAGLEVAHQAGVVHRDLKPANVLLHEGQPKLTDFGLARAKGIDRASLTETGVMMGTPAYMAPEQLEDARAVDARADVYALGVILYELLAGAQAFRGRGVLEIADAVLCGRYPPLPSEVPTALRRVVSRAMALDPGERYSSAEALALDLVDEAPEESDQGGSTLPLALLGLLALLGGVALALFLRAPLDTPPGPSLSESPREAPRATPGPGPLEPPVQSQSPPLSPSPTPEGSTRGGSEKERSAVLAPLDLCAERDQAQIQQGVSLLKTLAEAGNRWADLALGKLFLTGYGLARNLGLARSHFERAKDLGLVEAEVLLAHCEPLEDWTRRVATAEAEVSRRSEAGDLEASRFRLARTGVPPQAAGPAAEIYRLHALVLAVKTRAPGTRGRQDAVTQLLAHRDPDSRVDQVALRSELPLDPGLLGPEGKSPRAVLLEAQQDGARRAEATLGELILKGRIEGSRDEARRYLKQATLKASSRAGFTLWKLLPAGDPEGQRWLEVSARLGDPKAAEAYGVLLHEAGHPEARGWLEYAAARGLPNASGALASLLQDPDSSTATALRVRDLARKGVRHGRGAHLLTLGLSLADARIQPRDPTSALVILAALAVQRGDGEAALAAAALARESRKWEPLVRPLLRRALAHSATRLEAKARLLEVTQGIAASAPVASQSQLVLEDWANLKASPSDEVAKARRVAARVELGRRAQVELLGPARATAMRRAAETGDPAAEFAYAQVLYVSSKPGSRARAQALHYYRLAGEGGLAEGVFYYHLDATSSAQARSELQRLAQEGNPGALRFRGLQLLAQDLQSREGVRLLEQASALGDSEATEVLRWQGLQDPLRSAAIIRHYQADPGRYLLPLGQLYAAGQFLDADPQQARDCFLEVAVRGEQGGAGAFRLGRHLARDGDPIVALLWLLAAAERGDTEAGLLAAQVILGAPQLGRDEEGIKILRPLAAANAGAGGAKVSLGLAYLGGTGVKLDLRRGEELLEEVLARKDTSAEVRSLANSRLGSSLLRRRDPAGLALVEAAFAAGNPYSRILLAHGYLYGILLPLAEERGWKLLREGVAKGELESQFALARALLERESRRPEDVEEARALLEILGGRNLTRVVHEVELERLRELLDGH